MPIHINWYNEEQTILLIELDGKWELTDFINMYDVSRAMTKGTTHDYVIMVSFLKSASMPAKLLSVGDKFREPDGTNLPLMTIMIGMGRIYEIMLNLIIRIYPTAVKDARLVDTWEEGLALAASTLAQAKSLKENN